MLYLDANVFIHAVVDKGPRGAKASDILRSVAAGETEALTSVLTIDEVMYALRGLRDRPTAIDRGRQLLNFPNLRVSPVTPEHMRAAINLLDANPRLGPRDAVHAAVAISNSAHAIVSDDADFDAVKGIRRQGLA